MIPSRILLHYCKLKDRDKIGQRSRDMLNDTTDLRTFNLDRDEYRLPQTVRGHSEASQGSQCLGPGIFTIQINQTTLGLQNVFVGNSSCNQTAMHFTPVLVRSSRTDLVCVWGKQSSDGARPPSRPLACYFQAKPPAVQLHPVRAPGPRHGVGSGS